MEFSKIRFIRNPKSGIIRTQNLIRKAIDWNFADAGFDYEIWETEYPGHGHLLAQEAVMQGCDLWPAIIEANMKAAVDTTHEYGKKPSPAVGRL